MRTKVFLAVEGVPVHAWEKGVLQQLVGDSCSLESLAPESASRANLGLFRVEAWTKDIEGIPTERELWISEPTLAPSKVGSSSQASQLA
jgi:hypothetical protein